MRSAHTETDHEENTETLEVFLAWLQARGLAPATIRYYVADVAAYLRWLDEHPQRKVEHHARTSTHSQAR